MAVRSTSSSGNNALGHFTPTLVNDRHIKNNVLGIAKGKIRREVFRITFLESDMEQTQALNNFPVPQMLAINNQIKSTLISLDFILLCDLLLA